MVEVWGASGGRITNVESVVAGRSKVMGESREGEPVTGRSKLRMFWFSEEPRRVREERRRWDVQPLRRITMSGMIAL
jgi:hypothetical protein